MRDEKNSGKKSTKTYRKTVKSLKNRGSNEIVTEENQDELVKNAVSMFHNIPYTQQLEMKQNKHQELIQRLYNMKSIRSQVVGKVRNVIGSPVTEKYRNKDCMSVGRDVSGNITTGFHVSGGRVTVSPAAVPIIRDSHKHVARVYTDFLTRHVPRDHVSMYLGPGHGWSSGGWSEIMIRSNYNQEMMVNIKYVIKEGNEDNYEDETRVLLDTLMSAKLPISSVYITEMSVGVESTKRHRLIFGDRYLVEKIGEIYMNLGPETFCQGNSVVAEKMVEVVRDKVERGRSKTLLDLCCGAGMFGLHLATHFRGVIGIDAEDTAPARDNAEMNGVTNTRYLTGGVETQLPRLVADLRGQGAGVSAVLNPGRAGVAQSSIVHLRRFQQLNSLVYISCQPEDARGLKNLQLLMSPDRPNCPAKLRSEPFKMTYSIALDMFPHTHHCEHIFVFKR